MYIQIAPHRWLRADAITSVRLAPHAATVTLDESAPFLPGDKKTYPTIFRASDETARKQLQAWVAAQLKSRHLIPITAELFVVRSKVLVVSTPSAHRLVLRCRGGGQLSVKSSAKHPTFARPLEEIVAALTA
jgi:hypothetical protein